MAHIIKKYKFKPDKAIIVFPFGMLSCPKSCAKYYTYRSLRLQNSPPHDTTVMLNYVVYQHEIEEHHRGRKGILLFFQKTQTLQSKGVVTLFHLFTIAIYGRNCFDMQH